MPAAILAGGVSLLVVATLLLASVPPVSRDALTHHLALPKLYLDHGGMYEIPHLEFSYYPMNLELLYAVPLYFGNDIIPKFIHFTFALLTAALIYTYLRKSLGREYALGGVIAFLSLPVVVKLSITVYVDLGLIFFSTAALLYIVRWWEHAFPIRDLAIAAVFCGLALGTKYNALIVLLILSLFVPFVYSRGVSGDEGGAPRAIGNGLLFVGVALFLFLPWMLRNYLWTHNPLYPLFATSVDPIGSPAVDGMGHFLVRKAVFNERWWETLLIPIRIFFQGQDGNPRYFDGRLNPYLLLLPLFAFFRVPARLRPFSAANQMLFWFAGLYVLLVFLTRDMRIRYIAPCIPPLIILAMFGLHNLVLCATEIQRRSVRVGMKLLLWIGCATLLMLNFGYIAKQFSYVNPFSYLGGRLSRAAYIEKYRPEHAAFSFANQNIPTTARILGLFMGNRSYYSDREILFGIEAFKQALATEPSAAALARRLSGNGFTHLMVGHRLFNQWIGSTFDPESRVRLKMFVDQHLEPLFSANGYGLYRLKP